MNEAEAGAAIAGERVRIAEKQPTSRAGGLRSRQLAAPVIGEDSNVLARYLVAEEEADAASERQPRAAQDLIESSQTLFLAKTVSLEQALTGVSNGLNFDDALHHATCRSWRRWHRWRRLMIAALCGASISIICRDAYLYQQVPEWGSVQRQDGSRHHFPAIP